MLVKERVGALKSEYVKLNGAHARGQLLRCTCVNTCADAAAARAAAAAQRRCSRSTRR